MNSSKPYSEDAIKLAEELGAKYEVSVMAVYCEQLKRDDINKILEPLTNGIPVVLTRDFIEKVLNEEV